jgi:hypothetical protein
MRPIIISDQYELAGYSRDQMRGLLAKLPRFTCKCAEARVARVFSNYDVMLVVLFCCLETMYGLKRGVVSALSEPITAALMVPREVSKQACLVLRAYDATCGYVDMAPLVNDGLVIVLCPISLAIESYLLPMPLVQRDAGLSVTETLHISVGVTSVVRQEHTVQESVPQRHWRRSNHG